MKTPKHRVDFLTHRARPPGGGGGKPWRGLDPLHVGEGYEMEDLHAAVHPAAQDEAGGGVGMACLSFWLMGSQAVWWLWVAAEPTGRSKVQEFLPIFFNYILIQLISL